MGRGVDPNGAARYDDPPVAHDALSQLPCKRNGVGGRLSRPNDGEGSLGGELACDRYRLRRLLQLEKAPRVTGLTER
jgi:hypothetical protein